MEKMTTIAIEDLIKILNSFEAKSMRCSLDIEKDDKKYWLHIDLIDVTDGRFSEEEE